MSVVIIGAGRIGGALARRSEERGIAASLVTRERGWQALEGPAGAPIVVATRNDDLDEVLARVPARRREDLVLVQNGMLRPWIAAHGLGAVSRGLLFFAVARAGASIEVGAPSPFMGRQAGAIVRWLAAIEVPAIEVEAAEFAAVELEKLIWNAAFGLLCEVYSATVGEVIAAHEAELRALVAEMAAVGAAALEVRLAVEPLVARLCAYSRSISGYRGAVKEWRWRNGWFVAEAARLAVATPVHARLLARRGA
jgi:ketopantoate reductase